MDVSCLATWRLVSTQGAFYVRAFEVYTSQPKQFSFLGNSEKGGTSNVDLKAPSQKNEVGTSAVRSEVFLPMKLKDCNGARVRG